VILPYHLPTLVIMPRFNLNHEVVIYPNEKGWQMIIELTAKNYQVLESGTKHTCDRYWK
jgi:hypothetical protein